MSRTVSAKWTGVKFPCDVTDSTDEDLAEALTMAGSWLFSLSGGRVGQFTTIEDSYRSPAPSGGCGVPYKGSDGEWRNGGVEGRDCCTIELHRQPVYEISEVRIDGVALAAAEYSLAGNSLMRIGACWPADQADEVARLQVDYTWGVRPGIVAKAAAGELACEFLALLDADAVCNLPSAWTEIARQGVSVKRPEVTKLIKEGITGMPLTDGFIRVYNPSGLKQRARVIQIDGPRRAGS